MWGWASHLALWRRPKGNISKHQQGWGKIKDRLRMVNFDPCSDLKQFQSGEFELTFLFGYLPRRVRIQEMETNIAKYLRQFGKIRVLVSRAPQFQPCWPWHLNSQTPVGMSSISPWPLPPITMQYLISSGILLYPSMHTFRLLTHGCCGLIRSCISTVCSHLCHKSSVLTPVPALPPWGLHKWCHAREGAQPAWSSSGLEFRFCIHHASHISCGSLSTLLVK